MNIVVINLLDEIKSILEEYNNCFVPTISSLVGNLENYSKKLYDNAIVIAVKYNDIVLGFAAVYANDYVDHTAYLTQIAVNKNFRGKGISVELMKKVEQLSRMNGMNKIKLEVYDKNVTAVKFYLKCGFQFTEQASNNSKYMIKYI